MKWWRYAVLFAIALALPALRAQSAPDLAEPQHQHGGVMRQSGDRGETRRRVFEDRMKQRDKARKRVQQARQGPRGQRMPGRQAWRRVQQASASTVASDAVTTRLPVQSNDPATSSAEAVTTATTATTTSTVALPAPLQQAGAPSGPISDIIKSLPAESRRQVVDALQAMPVEQRVRLRHEIESAPAGERAARLMRAVGVTGPGAGDRVSTVAQVVIQAHPELEPYLAPPRGSPYVVRPADAKQRQYRASAHGSLPPTGRSAPAFTLQTLDGRTITNETFRGKPLVLEFGCVTCPVFRGNIPAMNLLADAAGDRAAFLLIYTVEAHPVGSTSPYSDAEWVPDKNVRDGVLRQQPGDAAGRAALAREAVEKHGVRLPVAVDSMDNAAWGAFGARPNSAFVIDAAGRIVLAQEWADPAGLRATLESLGSVAGRP